jgi:DhnA family fructose-bisphosphate aldolase class Ia
MTQQRAVIRRPGRVIAQAKRTGAIAILEMIKRGENEKREGRMKNLEHTRPPSRLGSGTGTRVKI